MNYFWKTTSLFRMYTDCNKCGELKNANHVLADPHRAVPRNTRIYECRLRNKCISKEDYLSSDDTSVENINKYNNKCQNVDLVGLFKMNELTKEERYKNFKTYGYFSKPIVRNA